MSRADELAGLAADLRALSERQRRAIFRELTAFERAQVEALLARVDEDESADPEMRAPADRMGELSPWLAKRLLRATSADDRPGRRGSVTTATREVIMALLRDAPDAAVDAGFGAPTPAMPKSLLGAMGGYLNGLARP